MPNEEGPIVIVGGGHAGVQLCAALVEAGQGARVHLVCEEAELPYQRPPLSKSFLRRFDETPALHRQPAWFAESGVTLARGTRATSIDRAARTLTLASGEVLAYRWLVLATGARPRRLPHLHDDLANVAALRNVADAERLRALLHAASALTVVGGGFIGLEVAASARALGKAVTVLESAPRLLMRSLSAEVAEHVLQTHRGAGIDVRLGVSVGGFHVEGGRLAAIEVDGRRVPVDLMLLGIGAAPDDTLAHAAGLEIDNGIEVDAALRTSDPAILAIGDCAAFPSPHGGRRLRLESVQNANDQARTACFTLLGHEAAYGALPWFWSEQGSLRLQMCGIAPAEGTRHRRPGANAASFSLLHYGADGRLACVESVNAPMDHLSARKLLEAGISPPPAEACDAARPLKSFL